jgi:hypothetical protein
MGKILHLPCQINKAKWAKEVYDAIVERGEKVAVIIQTPDTVETGYFGCNVIDKQVLFGHLQIDVMHDVMRATYDLESLE